MSIDVEDWFQVENLKSEIPRASWDSRELRVEANVDRLLEDLAAGQTRATFFILGWVAAKLPALIKRIAAAGHEIASHGFDHELVYDLSPEHFRRDVERGKKLLEDQTGRPVVGYRAPSFSITEWAVDTLRDLGFTYDSSAFPTVAHDRYGRLAGVTAARPLAEIRPGFHEIGVSCLNLGAPLPWGGGGYFRLLPYPVFKQGVRLILASGAPYVFYLHPWEIDPGQPRVSGLKATHHFRHYVNLGRTQDRFRALLRDFQWTALVDLLPA